MYCTVYIFIRADAAELLFLVDGRTNKKVNLQNIVLITYFEDTGTLKGMSQFFGFVSVSTEG